MKHYVGLALSLLALATVACETAYAPTLEPPTGTPSTSPMQRATAQQVATSSVPPAASLPTPSVEAAEDIEVETLTPVTLALGFVPNVQFAPFYVAIEKGYFARQGLVLDLDYGMENDLLQLAGSGERQFVVGSGDQVILARSQGLPVVYVMNWYRRFPIVVFSLEDLSGPEDLRGKTVGLPGLFGASYIGWQALLNATGLPTDEVTVETIGFTQAEAVAAGQVDAAVGYAMNEPVQLRQQGYDPSVIAVADYADLVANGIITNEMTMEEQPDLVQRVVNASLSGLRDTIINPEEAFEITLNYVPEAAEERETQLAVLQESIKFWQSDRFGYSDLATWEASYQLLRDTGLVGADQDVSAMFTNRFVESTDVR
jgi:NitT/TauT family transport system substrate-binding protein